MTILAAAAAVIRCFGPDCSGLTVTDLVNRLAMPKSNASRLLRTMRDVGLLETIGETKRYRPGMMLVDAARVYLSSSSLIERAAAAVAEVSQACGHTGYVSIREGVMVTAVSDHPGSNPLRVVSNIGRRVRADASATGRALLARLDDAAVRALYPRGLAPSAPEAPQTIEELLARLREARREGFAISHEETTRGVTGLATAVCDPSTGEEVSLCIVCPTGTTERAEHLAIAGELKRRAAAIAALTGDAVAARTGSGT